MASSRHFSSFPPRTARTVRTDSACSSSRPQSPSCNGAECVPKLRLSSSCCAIHEPMKRAWRWPARMLLLLIAAVVVYQFWIMGSVVWWIWFNPSTSAFMEDRLEILQQQDPDAVLRHKCVPYERISINRKFPWTAAERVDF